MQVLSLSLAFSIRSRHYESYRMRIPSHQKPKKASALCHPELQILSQAHRKASICQSLSMDQLVYRQASFAQFCGVWRGIESIMTCLLFVQYLFERNFRSQKKQTPKRLNLLSSEVCSKRDVPMRCLCCQVTHTYTQGMGNWRSKTVVKAITGISIPYFHCWI